MKHKSINSVTNYLTDILNNECNEIVEKLSTDFLLNYDELKHTYLENKSNNSILQNSEESTIYSLNKKKIKNIVDSNIRCLGIIKSGAQCARTRKCGYDYCKIHQKTLKFGKKIEI